MNESLKHTPGPWAVKEVPTSVGRAFKINTPDKLDESHGVIACIYADSTKLNKRPFDEHEANAYLIASAPDLLADRDKLRGLLREARDAGRRLVPLCHDEDATGESEFELAWMVYEEILARIDAALEEKP